MLVRLSVRKKKTMMMRRKPQNNPHAKAMQIVAPLSVKEIFVHNEFDAISSKI